jgi:hypothetical protein
MGKSSELGEDQMEWKSAIAGKPAMNARSRAIGVPVSLGLAAAVVMLAVYLTIVGLAQGWAQALSLLNQDKFLIGPITLSFGAQVGLYAYLRAIIRIRSKGSAAMTGASGGTSTLAMVACCAMKKK